MAHALFPKLGGVKVRLDALRSDVLGQDYKMRIAAKTLRTVDFKGGLDGFLMGTKNHKLTPKAKEIKKTLMASQAKLAAS